MSYCVAFFFIKLKNKNSKLKNNLNKVNLKIVNSIDIFFINKMFPGTLLRKGRKTMNKKTKLFTISTIYLLFIGLTGGSLGIIILPASQTFNVGPSLVASTYSAFSLGSVLLIISTTGLILKFISIKKCIFLQFAIAVIGYLLLLLSTNITIFTVAITIYGAAIGMAWSLGNYFVLSIYEGKEKNSKTPLLNVFYSIGAVVTPVLGGYLISRFNMPWKIVLTTGCYVLIAALCLSFFADFSIVRNEDKDNSKDKEESFLQQAKKWPASVWIIALSLCFYSMAEVSFTTWIVPYSEKYVGTTVVYASFICSMFWLFVGIGRFIITFVMKKITAETYLSVTSLLTAICLFLFTFFSKLVGQEMILIIVCLLGLGFSALLAVLNSFGNLQIKKTTRMLITLYLAVGSTAPVIDPILSGLIQKHFGYKWVMLSSAICMAIVSCLITAVIVLNKKRNFSPYEEESQQEGVTVTGH
jgi:MFS transporter, TsgA protein